MVIFVIEFRDDESVVLTELKERDVVVVEDLHVRKERIEDQQRQFGIVLNSLDSQEMLQD